MKATFMAVLAVISVTISSYGIQLDSSKYLIQHFNDENGLPQNSVSDLTFDNEDFLWISTQGGLTRFDGKKMVSHTKGKLKTTSDRFFDFGRDLNNWSIYCRNEHLQLIEIKDGSAINNPKLSQGVDSLLIKQLRGSGIVLDTIKNNMRLNKFRIILGKSGQYCIYTSQKVAFFQRGHLIDTVSFKGSPSFEIYPIVPNLRKIRIRETKKFINVEHFVNIYGGLFYHIGGEGVQFLEISPQGVNNTSLKGEILQDPEFINKNASVRIFSNKVEGQVFAVLGNNIYEVTHKPGVSYLNTKLVVAGFDVDKNQISKILLDRKSETLFLGSSSKGLFVVRKKVFQIIKDVDEKYFNNIFYAQVPYSDSSVITADGLVFDSQKEIPITAPRFAAKTYLGRYLMLRDKKGNFWINRDHKLDKLTTEGKPQGREWNFRIEPTRLFQDSDGTILIGFINGEVFYLPENADVGSKPKRLTKVNGEVTYLYESSGKIWIGTSGGLFWYDDLKHVSYSINGLKQKNIRSIYASAPDEIWITTYGDGIFLLSGGKLQKIPSDPNGYLDHAHCVLEDVKGDFWISSNKGLFRFSKNDLLAYARGVLTQIYYVYYNKNDGFLTNEFNGGCQPCALKLDDGHFSFPSMNGLVWFKPDDIAVPSLKSSFIIENIQADDVPLGGMQTISLKHDFGYLSAELSTVFFGNSENIEFYYTVDNAESNLKKWTKVGPDQKVNLYNLPPGSYNLIIRKVTGFGGQFIEKQLILNVAGPWYFRWWFLMFIIMSLAALFWLFTRWRFLNLKKQNESLSQKIQERTSHLSKALEDLKLADEALQTQLQIQMRIIGIINHDLHAPLKHLNSNTAQFLERVNPSLPDQEAVRFGAAISKSIGKVYLLADELLEFIKLTYNKNGEIVYEAVEVMRILEEKAAFFLEIAKDSKIDLIVEGHNGLLVNTNRVMLEILLHNLLDNAVKHNYSTTVKLSASKTSLGRVKISVSDVGDGLPPEILEWLSQPADKNSLRGLTVKMPGNLGLGLIIVREIAALLDVEITAYSGNGGTTIQLIC